MFHRFLKFHWFLKRCIVLATFFYIAIFLCIFGCTSKPPEPTGVTGTVTQNSSAPNFSLNDIYGRLVTLNQFKGKVVLLDFWATWCSPCRREIPHLIELYKEYKGQPFTLIGIALDEGGVSEVKPFVKKYHINYPIVIGDTNVQRIYGGIQGIPTKFLIDKKGIIVKQYVGDMSRNMEGIEKKIKSLL